MTASRLFPSHTNRQHTSEIDLHLRAACLGDLLAEAGRALSDVQLAGADCVPGGPVRTLHVASPNRVALLADWLNQLIFLADMDRWVGVDFSIDRATDTELWARGSGVTLEWGPARAQRAILRGLRVENVDGGLESDVTLEV